ncbi:FKB16G [Auxenochlorella protothecoides x Auxenochlorella symbiontica]
MQLAQSAMRSAALNTGSVRPFVTGPPGQVRPPTSPYVTQPCARRWQCSKTTASQSVRHVDPRVSSVDVPAEEQAAPMVAMQGDVVTLRWTCRGEDGEVMDSSDAHDAPATFEVGISDVAANPLIEVSMWQLVFYQGQLANLDGNCAQCLGVICCMQPVWGWQEVGSDLLQHAFGTAWSPLDPHTFPEQAFDSAVRGMAVGDKTSIQVEGAEWNPELLFRVPWDHPEMERLKGRYKNMGGVKEGLVVELSNGGRAVVTATTGDDVILDANAMLAGQSVAMDLHLTHIVRPT